MVLTHIATGWTECVPVRTRDGGLVIAAIQRARLLFPFPLAGVDFDNDSAFMNELVVCWCRSQGLEVTRSRAYRKNDQAWVEQKNGAIVRRLVGYGRFAGVDATASLVRLYDSVRLYGNLFQPSFKLREKTRIGARVIKRYHPPVPPAARVLAHPGVADSDRERLRFMMEAADPVTLFAGIRAAQEDLGKRVDRRGLNGGIIEPATIDLQRFVGNLKTAWRAGETRPTHRRPYRRTKPFPKRPSKYEPYQDEIRNWLEADPALSAAAVLQWLMAAEPTRFTPKSLRMTQRLVKMWRADIAARIIVDGGWTMTMSAAQVEARSDCKGNVAASALGNILP